MDWMKLRSYSRKSRTQKNVHCASPLPGVATSVPVGRKISKAKGSTHVKKQIKRSTKKGLPKIRELSEVTQMDCLSIEESVESSFNGNMTKEMNKNVKEMDTTPLKDSLTLNSASAKSLRNNETTSGMTLPTGISYFLSDCLDTDSTVSSSTEYSDCTSLYSSPEILRDERSLEENSASPQGPRLGCKNSTLLDTSKAISIDKMLQLPNLSSISARLTSSSSNKKEEEEEVAMKLAVISWKGEERVRERDHAAGTGIAPLVSPRAGQESNPPASSAPGAGLPLPLL
ncbi:hypothetical protein JRQ81_002659 [Phrynocephalus forsythii]|uniref:Meiosis-specific kinetochore protein n=1 Tax=Phrynocephalus forsythii TaxID=171643 RepID=A0A9Q0XLM5_9SAUR|nr:hypothetical protein JRQ81_002659 [Phrynocephalus forsythii]